MSDVERRMTEIVENFDHEEEGLDVPSPPVESIPATAALPSPQVAAPSPPRATTRGRLGFFQQMAQADKKVGLGVLPSTEELELLILASAFRKLRMVRDSRKIVDEAAESKRLKRIDDAMDLIQMVYSRRTSAKFAPTNRPRAGGSHQQDI